MTAARHSIVRIVAILLGALANVPARGGAPPWDARATPLPRQPITALAASPDGHWIAVATGASPGDANCFLLDAADGSLKRAHVVGQRWLRDLCVGDDGTIVGVCDYPTGVTAEAPATFVCRAAGGVTVSLSHMGETGYPSNSFQYGDHANAFAVLLDGHQGDAAWVADTQVGFRSATGGLSQAAYNRPADAVTVSFAAGAGAVAAVGLAVPEQQGGAAPNLFLLSGSNAKPLHAYPAVVSGAAAPALEPGVYGSPTLADGSRPALPYRDVPMTAPLSVALWGEGDDALIAAAHHRGWQRWVTSSATGKPQNHGTRFGPTRPTIIVSDRAGDERARFGPDQFVASAWLDLAFAAGGKRLLAWPHAWHARGLAGQTVLPADEKSRTVYSLDLAPAARHVHRDLPDDVCAAATDGQRLAVACWDGSVHILAAYTLAELDTFNPAAGAALVAWLMPGGPLAVASTAGVVRLYDPHGKELWQVKLEDVAPVIDKPRVKRARLTPIAPGIWSVGAGGYESDLGRQVLIEAPDGLILIEAHSGLSFEAEWAAIEHGGFDPRRVRYVLATHEHGDHAPGAYLWRVATGAQFACGVEAAYVLQHHEPMCSGYGPHPPIPTDIRIDKDTELDLAGLKMRALRLPGHTAGSIGWMFEKGGKRYVATGDLVMPDGGLGYAGTINASARDVLASLRKLDALGVDAILNGHGAATSPDVYVKAGIDVGTHTGWGRFPPERPDPRFRVAHDNVRVAAWNCGAVAADIADVNADGAPDVVALVPDPVAGGSKLLVFFNRKAEFKPEPDLVIPIPGVADPSRLRTVDVNADGRPDFVVSGGKASALLVAKSKPGDYAIVPVPVANAFNAHALGTGRCLVTTDFFGARVVGLDAAAGVPRDAGIKSFTGSFHDVVRRDFNGRGGVDWFSTHGALWLDADAGPAAQPAEWACKLPAPGDWHYAAAGDFNGDKHPDLVVANIGQKPPVAPSVYLNTGDPDRPFRDAPDVVCETADPKSVGPSPNLPRDMLTVADWDGDGFDDLIVAWSQRRDVSIFRGGPKGLETRASITFALDGIAYYAQGPRVADFDGDGKPDLAVLVHVNCGAGVPGPLAVHIWLHR